jgi:cbb3-type cytochrome oxidase cytochrome c subunit
MKGLFPLFLGFFGTFAFSWAGLTVIPNFQIGHLEPQTDEEQTEFYPQPKSGMVEYGRRIYVANGCHYCHSQWLRPGYAAADIDRKWGERRSAPRDYIFDRPVLLGKTRLGPDLSNVGKRAPEPEASPSPGASPAVGGASPAAAGPAASPAASPVAAALPQPSPAGKPAAVSPAPARAGSPPPAGAAAPAGASPSPAPAASPAPDSEAKTDEEQIYSAAWHHRHLYAPRSITLDSNMPAYRFLYEKRRVSGERSADALKLSGADAPPESWEIVPTNEAKSLVAYLMSLDQSHPLKEVKSAPAASAPAASPSPAAPAAGAVSPAPTPAAKGSP